MREQLSGLPGGINLWLRRVLAGSRYLVLIALIGSFLGQGGKADRAEKQEKTNGED